MKTTTVLAFLAFFATTTFALPAEAAGAPPSRKCQNGCPSHRYADCPPDCW
ncbi:hypothetical protein Vi05172_g11446 [Venturia inaequalis]|nr:hypothetical protein Vi05172_g11446 [Venturia inaequalis]